MNYTQYDPAHVHVVTQLNGVQQYWYDANGNMTTRNDSTGSYTQQWDTENRLTTVSGSGTATFVYDGDGNRVKATLNGTTTAYVGNYYEQTNSVTTTYYYAGGTRVAMRQGTIVNYLLDDHLGSTAITANSSGGFYSELRYKSYGETRYTNGTTPTRHQFTGQITDTEIGLYFYGARYYSAYLNRWIQADTIVPEPGDPQTLNRYSYTNNNPVKYTDPTGHCAQDKTQDWTCWLQYYTTLGDLGLGYEPKDLYTWGINDLANLSSWIAMGVKFTGNGWSSNTMAGVRDALNRANSALSTLGAKIVTALGLHDPGGLTFSFGPMATCAGYICTDQGTNTIGGNFDESYRNYGQNYAEEIVHELGHVVDWHARPSGSQFGWSVSSQDWLLSAGWWPDPEHGRWRITREGSLGAPTDNALNTPGEDFADTFTWYVQTQNHLGFSRLRSNIPEPNPARQNALTTALGEFQ